MPFHHLGTQKFWSPFTESGERSPHRTTTRYIGLTLSAFAAAARRSGVSPAGATNPHCQALRAGRTQRGYSLVGMPVPDDDETALDAAFEARGCRKSRPGGTISPDVVSAYNYTCPDRLPRDHARIGRNRRRRAHPPIRQIRQQRSAKRPGGSAKTPIGFRRRPLVDRRRLSGASSPSITSPKRAPIRSRCASTTASS